MRRTFILSIVGVAIVFGMANYYIGLRFWQSLVSTVGNELESYYWTVFLLLAGTYFWGRIGAIYFPGDFSDRMIWVGSYWLGMAFYLCLFWLLYDLGVFIVQSMGLVPYGGSHYSLGSGIMMMLIVSGVIAYGAYNARIIKVRPYHIIIPKRVDQGGDLHIVMISDLHLGLLVGRERLRRAVEIINELKPDVVLLPGDIIDENIGAFVENGMPEVLHGIHAKFGVFGVLGSHEYIYGHAEKTLLYLQQSGVEMLQDRYIQLPNGAYLVGRDDLFRARIVGSPRAKLSKVLKGCKEEYPIILMDHQPVDLEEAQAQGVDLQLSGHTHHGQLFPLTIFTQWFFEIDWGYLQKGMYQIIVSSGYGTWGPPIRVGTSSEIVDIRIVFVPPA